MSARKLRKKELRALEKQERELEEALAESVARIDDLIARKERPAEWDKREEALADLNRTIREVRKRKRSRQSRLKKVRQRIAKKRRQIRNLARPKIVNLGLAFRPMTAQHGGVQPIGHYTAGPTDDDDPDAARLWRLYHQAHLNQGWSGEGYHIGVARSGTIFLMRPVHRQGAHTLGRNANTIGIVVHGTTGDRPTKAQLRSLRWLAANAHTKKMPPGWRVPNKLGSVKWTVHKDWNPTACPGSFETMYRTKGRSA